MKCPANESSSRFGFDPDAVVCEPIPVVDDRRERAEQAIGNLVLLTEVRLRLDIAQHRTAGAHDVHRVRRLRNSLEDFLYCLRQAAPLLQFGLVGVELFDVRQFPVKDQIGDLFERGAGREF